MGIDFTYEPGHSMDVSSTDKSMIPAAVAAAKVCEAAPFRSVALKTTRFCHDRLGTHVRKVEPNTIVWRGVVCRSADKDLGV